MNKISNNILGLTVLALFALTTVPVMGQELEFSGFGGFSGLSQGNTKLSQGNSFGFSILYMHPLNDHWKVGLGGEFGLYKLKQELSNPSGSYSSVDGEGDAFDFRYKMSGYTEDLEGNYFSIPLKVQYESSAFGNSDLRFYASAGIKYQLYSKVKSVQLVESLSTSGYYEQWDVELHNPLSAGFGDYGNQSFDQKFKLDDGLFVLGELGVKYSLGKGQSVYLGVYGDYDLKSSGRGEAMVSYLPDSKTPVSVNSVLPLEGDKYKLRMFSLGVKLKYSFGF
jgi:hypothetical protein